MFQELVCNWASSSEMETDIFLEGSMEAERVHGLRYVKFIGDRQFYTSYSHSKCASLGSCYPEAGMC